MTAGLRDKALRAGLKAWSRTGRRPVARLFHTDLIAKTGNFSSTSWLGVPIWQNVLDLWTIQETISEIRPALLIETGTNRGGSALFYAQMADISLVQADPQPLMMLKIHSATGTNSSDILDP